jgi:hypothetical protein
VSKQRETLAMASAARGVGQRRAAFGVHFGVPRPRSVLVALSSRALIERRRAAAGRGRAQLSEPAKVNPALRIGKELSAFRTGECPDFRQTGADSFG